MLKKKGYEEVDWNWITQDFHLFIFRKYLHNLTFKADEKNLQRNSSSDQIAEIVFPKDDTLEIPIPELYQPAIFPNDNDSDEISNRNLNFSKNHYLKKYQAQLEKGAWAEQVVKKDEIKFLVKSGKNELAERVEVVSTNPDHGFDILSYEVDGTPKQIEVKSISSEGLKSFFISANELRKSSTLSNFYIYCVFSKDDIVQKIFRLKNPNLNDSIIFKLVPINYQVSFF